MKKLLSKNYALSIVAAFFILPQLASAATFDIDVKNLTDPSGINSVTFWLDVDDSFTFLTADAATAMGAAIPTTGILGWSPSSSLEVGLFKIDAFDLDDTLSMGSYPLTNGSIFSFDYTGTILSFNRIEFGIGSTNVYGTEVFLDTFNPETGALFTGAPVPLPGAVWLLGAGLSGLVALRRKNR